MKYSFNKEILDILCFFSIKKKTQGERDLKKNSGRERFKKKK